VSIPSKGLDREIYDRMLVEELHRNAVDLVCLAGFMRLLSASFIREFPNRILNIHPSLLPAFPGLDAQHQALAHGVKITGCTVHFVDEDLDAGPILIQAAVPVLNDDTVEALSERILREEHRIYSEAIGWRWPAPIASRAGASFSAEGTRKTSWAARGPSPSAFPPPAGIAAAFRAGAAGQRAVMVIDQDLHFPSLKGVARNRAAHQFSHQFAKPVQHDLELNQIVHDHCM